MQSKSTEEITESLVREYRNIIQDKILPVTKRDTKEIKYDKNSLNNFVNDLKEKKYWVSVCGVMNSGKTTLLNALVFDGERVLAENHQPETATLTELGFGEEFSAEVTYYCSEEWEEVYEALKKSDRYEDEIKPELKKAEEQNIISDVICDKGFTKKINSIDELQSHIAKGPGDPLQYFSKYVFLKYPSDILKSYTFVDTPGTQDPNEIRSALTEKFIGRSSAVLMMLSQKILQPDIDFMEEYLKPIKSDKIISVLNKVDLLGNVKNVENYVMENLPEVAKFNLDDDVVGVSALMGLLQKRLNNNLQLSGDDSWYMDKWKQEGKQDLMDKEGNIPYLKEKIDKNLQEREGEIFEVHRRKILGVYESKMDEMRYKINFAEDDIQDFLSTTEELEEKKTNLEEFVETIRVERQKIERYFAEKRDYLESELDEIFEEKYQKSREIIFNKIDEEWERDGDRKWQINKFGRHKSLKSLARNLDNSLRDVIHDYFKPKNSEYKEKLEGFERDITNRIDKFTNQYRQELSSVETLVLVSNPYKLEKDFRSQRDSVLSMNFIDLINIDWADNLRFIIYPIFLPFEEAETEIQALDNFKKECKNILIETKNKLIGKIKSDIFNEHKKMLEDWLETIEEEVDKRIKRLEDINDNLDQKNMNIEQLRDEVENLTTQKESISSKMENAKQNLNQLQI